MQFILCSIKVFVLTALSMYSLHYVNNLYHEKSIGLIGYCINLQYELWLSIITRGLEYDSAC